VKVAAKSPSKRAACALAALFLISGCSSPPALLEYSWEFYAAPPGNIDGFATQSLAILPAVKIEYDPSQEGYREALGGLLYDALSKYDTGPHIIPIAATQSGINRAQMWGDVLAMYKEYETTAVLRKDTLGKLGKVLGARYVILPKVLRFQQEVFDRATVFGISVLRTRQSTVDIHAQIWDTETGEVIWQGVGEGSAAAEVVEGRPVSFLSVAQYACESLALRLPWAKNHQDAAQATGATEGSQGAAKPSGARR